MRIYEANKFEFEKKLIQLSTLFIKDSYVCKLKFPSNTLYF